MKDMQDIRSRVENADPLAKNHRANFESIMDTARGLGLGGEMVAELLANDIGSRAAFVWFELAMDLAGDEEVSKAIEALLMERREENLHHVLLEYVMVSPEKRYIKPLEVLINEPFENDEFDSLPKLAFEALMVVDEARARKVFALLKTNKDRLLLVEDLEDFFEEELA